jgi:hypothetical protein
MPKSSGDWLFSLLGWSWILVLPLWIAVGFYIGKPVTEQISFLVDDGWCNGSVQGIGRHCFGDYYAPIEWLQSTWHAGNLWSLFNHPYPPTANYPYVLAFWADRFFGDQRLVLLCFLRLLGVSMLMPAFILVRGRFCQDPVRWIPFFLLGVGSTPFIIILDRGSALGFSMPFLLIFTWGLFRDKSAPTVLSLVVLVCLKPHFALLAIVFLFLRRYQQLFMSAGCSLIIFIIGFVLWPGDMVANFSAWLENVLAYSGYVSLHQDWPPNYSASKSLFLIFNFLNNTEIGNLDSSYLLLEWVTRYPGVPGALLLLVTLLLGTVYGLKVREPDKKLAFLLVLPLPMLVPGTSWAYYSLFSIVIASAIALHPCCWFRQASDEVLRGILDGSDMSIFLRGMVIFTLLITIIPAPGIAWPNEVGFVADEIIHGLFSKYVGLAWLLLVVSLIIYATKKVINAFKDRIDV